MSHSSTTERRSLDEDLNRAGFYPVMVADVVHDALDEREPLSHVVHLETHFDRNEVHRHITVLVLTEDMLVITHVDDQQDKASKPAPKTRSKPAPKSRSKPAPEAEPEEAPEAGAESQG